MAEVEDLDAMSNNLENSKTLLQSQKANHLSQDPILPTEKSQDYHVLDLTLKSKAGGKSDTVVTENTLTKKSKPAYLQSLNESEKQANFRVIENMNKKISFLKNPRHKKNRAPIIMTDAHKSKAAIEASAQKTTSFRAEPSIL